MWKYAWRETVRRKNRSIAAISSYLMAVLIFGLLVSLLNDSDHSMNRTLQSTGTHFIAFRPISCDSPHLRNGCSEGGFWANGTRSALLSTDLLDEIKKIPGVKDASPMLMFIFPDSTSRIGFTVAGFIPENKISAANTTCSSADLVEGSFITSNDTNAVMIEYSYSISRRLQIRDTLQIAGKVFLIRGIVNAGIRPVKADVYMPFNQAEKIMSTRTWTPLHNQMNIILVESANAKMHMQAINDVKNLLGNENVVSSYACHKSAASAINLNSETLWFAVFLMTVFILVYVVRSQYASVVERRREIGILHSIGWSKKNIVLFLGYELILQALIGGIAGYALSVLYQSYTHGMPLYWSEISLTGLGLTLLTSVISALIIANYAAAVQPMKGLRAG